ncbi:MAG: hypothetical protein ACLQK4_16950 [Acidimicrobiales bacterium]
MEGSDIGVEKRLAAIEDRLHALERAAADARRRQLMAEMRQDPARHLSGIADVRRVIREDLDEIADVLSRWDVPLTIEERTDLQRAGLVAQAIVGHHGAKVHLVVEVVTTTSMDDLDRVERRARVFSVRNRRAIPIVLSLEPPGHGVAAEAQRRGIEIAVDE